MAYWFLLLEGLGFNPHLMISSGAWRLFPQSLCKTLKHSCSPVIHCSNTVVHKGNSRKNIFIFVTEQKMFTEWWDKSCFTPPLFATLFLLHHAIRIHIIIWHTSKAKLWPCESSLRKRVWRSSLHSCKLTAREYDKTFLLVVTNWIIMASGWATATGGAVRI